jgi:hypothetical protein
LDLAVHVLNCVADRKSYGLLKNDRFKPLRQALKALMSSNPSSSTHHLKGKTAMKRLIKGDTRVVIPGAIGQLCSEMHWKKVNERQVVQAQIRDLATPTRIIAIKAEDTE